MKHLVVFLTLVLLPLAVQAEPPPLIVRLWPGDAPMAHGQSPRDIPTLSIYFPAHTSETAPAIIICPGGGYRTLNFAHEGLHPAQYFQSKGWVAAALTYRLPINGYAAPVPFIDLQRAIRLVRYNAMAWHINRTQVGVLGFSAGGHLAGCALEHSDFVSGFESDAVDACRDVPDFGILAYPVVSMEFGLAPPGSRDQFLGPNPTQAMSDYYSLERNVRPTTPPVYLVNAEDDKVISPQNNLLLDLALRSNKVPSYWKRYPIGGHGFGYPDQDADLVGPPNWIDRAITWLQPTLEHKG